MLFRNREWQDNLLPVLNKWHLTWKFYNILYYFSDCKYRLSRKTWNNTFEQDIKKKQNNNITMVLILILVQIFVEYIINLLLLGLVFLANGFGFSLNGICSPSNNYCYGHPPFIITKNRQRVNANWDKTTWIN